jgi:RimJ/RimL family protein N-acetyltransferase
MMTPRLFLSPMEKKDLSFLLALWHDPAVMRYADEFPKIRGWSKTDDTQVAWKRYAEKLAQHGTNYSQLLLHLEDGTPIGESFFGPLPEGYTFGKWRKPPRVNCLIGDIKLLPQYWGQGLGTEAMCLIVRFIFTKTTSELFVVPPHRHNLPAIRVYEKAGFRHFTQMRSWRNHKIMELSRKEFQEL